MLRSVEIRTVLTGVAHSGELSHALHFLPKVEFSLDCFICQRTGRTAVFHTGTEQALCTSDEQHGPHPTAARVAGFDTTTEDASLTLRAVIDYWWAPFHDAKRDGPPRVDHPGNLGGSDPWKDAESCRHRRSTRTSCASAR
jgi:hypothetical protein